MLSYKIGRNGISPLVTTVILVGFVVAVIAIVILWGRDFIQEKAQKSGALEEVAQDCLSIDIRVETEVGESGIFVYNEGNVPFEGLIIRQHCIGDTLAETKIYHAVDVGQSLQLVRADVACGAKVTLPAVLYNDANRFELIPAKRPSGRGAPLVPCSDAKEDVKLS
mgnify:FL=1